MSDQQPTDTAASYVPRGFKVILGLSLALNLIVIGVVVGAGVRGGGPMRGGGMSNYAIPYVMALPKEDRRAIFKSLRGKDGLPDRGARRALYQDMVSALKAEPFDPAAVQSVLDAQSSANVSVLTAAQVAWTERVTAMSPQKRAEYAGRVEEVLKRGPRKGKRRPAE